MDTVGLKILEEVCEKTCERTYFEHSRQVSTGPKPLRQRRDPEFCAGARTAPLSASSRQSCTTTYLRKIYLLTDMAKLGVYESDTS